MKPVARLYEQNGYRRASVKPGPGKPLVLLEEAEHEIERIKADRDEWARKWHKMRKELAELKYPGMNAEVHALDA